MASGNDKDSVPKEPDPGLANDVLPNDPGGSSPVASGQPHQNTVVTHSLHRPIVASIPSRGEQQPVGLSEHEFEELEDSKVKQLNYSNHTRIGSKAFAELKKMWEELTGGLAYRSDQQRKSKPAFTRLQVLAKSNNNNCVEAQEQRQSTNYLQSAPRHEVKN